MKRGRDFFFAAFSVALLVFLTILFSSCQREKPQIKIGFAGGLTGRYSDLGTAGRNGANLAVEEINQTGGIRGRQVLLISKDDKQDEQTAVRVDRELIAEGAVAIIGHMTSSMSVAALPLMNEKGIVLLSPTSTTNVLNGKDDFFIRLEPANKKQTEDLVVYASKKMRLKRIAAVYDLSNQSYTEDYFRLFSSLFRELGGEIVAVETYKSTAGFSFAKIASRLLKNKPEGILLIANALDAADFCQQIRKAGSRAVILSSGWAMTESFLSNGGKAVEGVVFDNLINVNSRNQRYIWFKNSYKLRFGEYPGFGAVHGYEAARLLLDALKVNEDPKRLKETILGLKGVYGLFGDFRLDRFGDAERDFFIMSVKGGHFQQLE